MGEAIPFAVFCMVESFSNLVAPSGFLIIPDVVVMFISNSSPKNLLTLVSSATLPVLIKMLGSNGVISSKLALSAFPCQILREIGTYL